MIDSGDERPISEAMQRAAMVCRVRDQIIAGATRKDITDYAAEQGWQADPPDLAAIVNEARAEIAAYVMEDRNTEFALASERLSGLYRACLFDLRGYPLPREKQDRRAAFNVLREINELYGLHAPKKFDVADKTVRALSAEQLETELTLALETIRRSRSGAALPMPAAEISE